MNENIKSNVRKENTNKKFILFLVVIFIWFLCGAGGVFLGFNSVKNDSNNINDVKLEETKDEYEDESTDDVVTDDIENNQDETIEDSGDYPNDDVKPIKNAKYTFLNSIGETFEDIKITTYFYLDEQELFWLNEDVETTNTFYVLRSETFINGQMIGDTRILEVVLSKDNVDYIVPEYSLYHIPRYLSDTKSNEYYTLITLSNNDDLIDGNKYIVPTTQLPVYNNMNLQKTYLVNKEGKILKEFKYSDCWLSGIVIDSDEIEDRYTTFDDFTVFDKKRDDFVEISGEAIYAFGEVFDTKKNYFYWIDRINGNKEYKFYVENGKLIEKYIKTYDYDSYYFSEINCV